jgi:hypothetical protein
VAYLENKCKDPVQKFSLMNEAKNDPIKKKPDLIRDMVLSISKIPDRIKEIYVQECLLNYGYLCFSTSYIQKDAAGAVRK